MQLYADGIDIIPAVGNLTWQNSIAELSTIMSFDVAKTDAKHTSIYLPRKGSIIHMHTNEEIFRKIVPTVDDGDETKNTYTVADFGWYIYLYK